MLASLNPASARMANHVRDLPQLSLSLITRLRLLLFGHEDLAGIIFWAALTGFLGALASVLFREGSRLLERLFTGQNAPGLVEAAVQLVWWHRMVIPIAGGVLAGLILHWAGRVLTVPRAVDYMEAVLVGDGRIGFRTTLLSSLSSLFSIASGGSIGREGPMVQLAAMIGSKMGILARASIPRLRLMVACGAAAGIAAAYNAPISGALFVSEIVLGNTAMESFGPLVVASVTSNATIHRFLGYGPLFAVPHVHFASNLELVFFIVLGVLLGHLAPPFLNFVDFAKSRFVRLHWPPYWQLGLGGVIVGAISIWVPQVWGNGYSVVGDILQGDLFGTWLLAVLVAKVLATAATVGSGAVGGIFTPTLFIGCAIGALFGELIHTALPTVTSVPAAYALIGMGGFLAATTHAPLTSILMIFEMTGDYDIVLPLMLACVAAHYTAKVYRHGESVYHGSLARAAAAAAPDDWRLRTVEPLVKPPSATVPRTATVQQMLEQLPARPLERVYVVDGDQLISWLDPRRVLDEVQKGTIQGSTLVEQIAHPVSLVLSPDMALGTALDGFLREQATVLPVTRGPWRNSLVGEVSRREVLLAIQDRLTFPK
ncbi:MAG TPA: ClcB-like voltage-gated chloride channel protein [Steroidobacteraceae bacterium]|nr:ClcB-like voltage-gated chloride channel protein [Steroidobacteraceae bacterium]